MLKTLENHRKLTVAQIKKLYTWKLIRKIQRIRIRYSYTHTTPLTYRTSNPPPPVALFDNSRYRLNFPDANILNMKVVQNGSTNMDTPSACLSDASNTAGMEPSPSGCTSGNYPELAVHPRMNSRSEQSTLYCDRTPLTLHMSCIASVCIWLLCIYCFFPLPSGRPRDCRRRHCRVRLLRRRPDPYRWASRQAEPFPSPTYRLPFLLFLH